MALLRLLASFLSLCMYAEAVTELLHNAEMESAQFSGNWYCQGNCQLSASTDSYRGHHSVKVTNRHHNWEGLSQNVQVTPGHIYKMTGYIKLLNLPTGSNYEKVELLMTCKDTHEKDQYFTFGTIPYVQMGIWTEIGGVNRIHSGYHSCHVYIQTPSVSVNYLVDHLSLKEVPADTNWKSSANQRIEQLRKADVTVSVVGSNVQSSTSLQIEFIQTSQEFGFGSAVGASMIVDSTQKAYQNAFYDNFEWAVLENALKWRPMEWTRGHVNYNTPMAAITALKSHGIKVRGHNVFWGVDQFVQDWVKAFSKQDLLTAIHDRVQGVIGHTKGKLEHWDVNNEDLHGDFYERHTGNANITMDMFRQVHAVDPHPKLFLNEYAILANSDRAMALKDQAKLFRQAGVPIYGVGIQSHVSANLDIQAIKARLDLVAEAGLPIWITELTVKETNVNKKATALSDLLTLFFSHPAVEGVLFWGFWDSKLWIPEAAIFEGPNLTPNAAGKAYQTLFKTTWRTHETHSVHGNTPLHMRGFKGTYTVKVKHAGHVLKTETFTLDKNGQSLQIHVTGTGHAPSVSHIVVG